MGWKNFKQHYELDLFVVQINGNDLEIGSGSLTRQIVVDINTGKAVVHHPLLFALADVAESISANPGLNIKLIQSQDSFSQDLPVYYVTEEGVHKTSCEKYGYPNFDHQGRVMLEGQYFENEKDALVEAVKYLNSLITGYDKYKEDKLAEIKEIESKQAKRKAVVHELKTKLKSQGG